MVGVRRLLEASDGLAANRSGGGADMPQANFDTNMVIILAALLCALICALGLNSMVRCFMRCTTHRFGFESSQQAAARTGLKKSALKKIPILVHGSDRSCSDLNSNLEDSNLNAECPICLGEFIDGEKIRVLPKCNHTFHVKCIDTWLGSHSSCPNCRHSLLESFRPSTATTSGGRREEPPRHGGGGEEQVVVVQVNDVS